jgi:hypothetical protein
MDLTWAEMFVSGLLDSPNRFERRLCVLTYLGLSRSRPYAGPDGTNWAWGRHAVYAWW